MHSINDDRNAADVSYRLSELSARPSIAAQKEVKNSPRGEEREAVEARIYKVEHQISKIRH